MANPNRRSVASARKLLALVLGAIAAFVMVFGAGMTSWPIAALGVALLVLAIALSFVNIAGRGARAWVAGTAHVRSVSEPPAGASYGRCELHILVAAPGLPAAAVTVRDPRVPVSKWPDPGSTLPVMVAIDDLRRVRIQWDDVMTHAEAAAGEAPEEYADPGTHEMSLDDFLDGADTPPWRTGNRYRGGAEPTTADLSTPLADLRERSIAVREPGSGPIVLEGTVVEPATPAQRRKPSPFPRGHAATAAARPGEAGGASEDSGPASARTGSGDATSAGPATTDPATAGPATADRATVAASEPGASTADRDTETADEPSTGPSPDATPAAETPAEPIDMHDDIDLPLDDEEDHRTGRSANAAAGEAADGPITTGSADSGPAVNDSPPFAVITGIEEPRTPITTGINGTDLNKAAPERRAARAAAASADRSNDSEPDEALGSSGDERAAVGQEQAGTATAASEDAVGDGSGPTAPTASAPDADATADSAPAPAPKAEAEAITDAASSGPGTVEPTSGLGAEAAAEPASGLETAAPAAAGSGASSVAAGFAGRAQDAAAAVHHGADGPETGRGQDDDHGRLGELITAYPSARPGPAGAIHGIGMTMLVTDLDRSRRFYREVLGFHEIDAGGDTAVLASGDTRLVLRRIDQLSGGHARPVQLNLEVGNVEAMYAELVAKGAKSAHGPMVVSRGEKLELWSAGLTDPDGHTVAISQWRAVA